MKNYYYFVYSLDPEEDYDSKNLIGIYFNEHNALKKSDLNLKDYEVFVEHRTLDDMDIKRLSNLSFLLQEDVNHFTDCGNKIFAELVEYNKNADNAQVK